MTAETLKKQIQFIQTNMKLVGQQPNKMQTAIAIAVAYMSPQPRKGGGTKKNHLVVVPPAKGKTRITIATALCLLWKYKKAHTIVIVYPNEGLMKQDAEAWSKLKEHLPDLKAELQQVVGIEAAEKVEDKNKIILVDEADKMFIDDVKRPPKNCKVCIGLTGTIPSNKSKEGVVIK